jgi:hypothetical protein
MNKNGKYFLNSVQHDVKRCAGVPAWPYGTFCFREYAPAKRRLH